jgi:hypothetical protein
MDEMNVFFNEISIYGLQSDEEISSSFKPELFPFVSGEETADRPVFRYSPNGPPVTFKAAVGINIDSRSHIILSRSTFVVEYCMWLADSVVVTDTEAAQWMDSARFKCGVRIFSDPHSHRHVLQQLQH